MEKRNTSRNHIRRSMGCSKKGRTSGKKTKAMVEARRGGGARHKKATPPILSHDFVIQNHGDIMSCILMVFIVGLMFPLTSPLAAVFIAPQYNETTIMPSENSQYEVTGYRNGILDVASIIFYTIAWVVIHAILQEYVLDKLQRKAHLSKASNFKFTESGHMLAFSIYSVAHALHILQEYVQGYGDFKRIWIGYPEEHRWMSSGYKMFFIFQISYWLHQFPEFYFQKLKKDEIRQKTFISVLHILFITAAYFMNFTRIGVALLLLEYTSQAVFHFARLSHFLDKKTISKPVFKLWNVVFVLARIGSAVLAVMTFWYGLRQVESPYVDPSTGNFNTTFVRLNILLLILLLQLFQLWSFVTFHLTKYKESNKKKGDKKPAAQPIAPKKKQRNEDSQSESESLDPKTAKKKN
ncbi:unnamed protein product [Caenorhabditis auriculariae]|uniref:TLC domain-containing protein n=1 Tax=Caenorhabditis auriculariae TaxID=2777116 RepID=A0A8S1HQS8_9PELO|nr:unnamed protein product [Caenorhabditis auriculariae]